MKRLVLLAVVVFWIAMSAVWVIGWLTSNETSQRGTAPSKAVIETRVTRSLVAEHGTAESCWLLIDGRAYDVTDYVERHPADPRTILDYCGKDATQAFATKDRGRPHSGYARGLLGQYQVGVIAPE